jgi:ferritin-like metal-binding protein YciE
MTSQRAAGLDRAIQSVEKYNMAKYLSLAYWQPLQSSKQETLIKEQIDHLEKYTMVYLSNFISTNKIKIRVPELKDKSPYRKFT